MTQNTTQENATEVFIYCQYNFIYTELVLSPTGEHVKMNIVLIVIHTVLSLLGTFANVLVIASYMTNRRLHTPSNLLFVFLAVSDVMVTACVQPLLICSKLSATLKLDNLCILKVLVSIGTFSCSILSLNVIVVLSVERFITLAFPYHYHRIVSLPRLKLTIAAIWFIGCAACFVFFFALISFNVFNLIAAVYMMLSVAIVISAWAWIQRLVNRHNRKIEGHETTPN